MSIMMVLKQKIHFNPPVSICVPTVRLILMCQVLLMSFILTPLPFTDDREITAKFQEIFGTVVSHTVLVKINGNTKAKID